MINQNVLEMRIKNVHSIREFKRLIKILKENKDNILEYDRLSKMLNQRRHILRKTK